jgi:TonB-linked SusC/RagA family outer membrane protein
MMMKKQYIKIIVALLSMNLLLQVSSFAQNQKTIVVKDESGNPVPGVSVTVGEAAKPVTTNEKGEFVIQTEVKTPVLLEAEGYDSQIVISTPPLGLQNIVLVKTPYQMGVKDNVNLPFGQLHKRQIPGSVTTIDPWEILNYDQQGSISGAIYGRVPGFFGSSNNRGLGSPLIVVDGVPRPASELNLQQVGQITVLKDLSSAMLYGGQGNNGIIYVTTRRGAPLKKSMRFTATTGISKPISYPNFLNSADYMTLYNEALANDGLPAKYTQAQIDNTASGADPIHYPDQSYYNSTYLKNFSNWDNVVGEASGGNEVAQYYLNLGWNRSTGLLKVGNGDKEKTDRLSMRGNVNYQLTDAIRVRFDGSAIFNIGYVPRYTSGGSNLSINATTGQPQWGTNPTDFWAYTTTYTPDIFPVLIPSSLIKDKAQLAAAKLVNGSYVLGGTSSYLTNIYGDLTFNGLRQNNSRLIEISSGLDFDLSSITPGLKASVYGSFDMFSFFMVDIANTYAIYKPNYAANPAPNDTITSFTKSNSDIKVTDQTVSDVTFYRRTGAYGTIDYHRIFGDQEITVNALAYRDQYFTESVLQPTKHLHFGLRANYILKKKYIAELTGVLAGSVKLFETDKYAFSPGIGLGWVVSEESFLQDNSLINYLKLRANFAISNTDESLSNYYLGRDLYSSSGSYGYNQGTNSNNGYVINSGNPNVTFEKRMNFNAGLDALLLDSKLAAEASYFYYKSYDVITRRLNVLPVFFTGLPYENFGASQNQGVEIGLNYTEKVGDLQVRIGTEFVYSVPKALIVDELNYNEAYRKLTGKPSDAIFGLVAEGLFKDQADINASPFQTFGTVKPGDIKYKDLNGDGLINDLDQKMIGNSSARVEYGLNLGLKYKGFEFFALGTGQVGQKRTFTNSYYWVYGTRKYSDVVLNRWTPGTAATATYPELTTLSNANNFRTSTFWLYDYNWFTLSTAQLTYTLPIKIGGTAETRIFVRGGNLFMISKLKDKAQLNIGSTPQTRSVSIGLTVVL